MNKITISTVALTFLSLTACNGSGSPSANFDDITDYQKINQSSALTDSDVYHFQQEISACASNDHTCRGKSIFKFYDKAFEHEGFSQIKTASAFIDWTAGLSKGNPSRIDLQLNQRWAQTLMGAFICVNDQKCSGWLVAEGKATQEEIKSIREKEHNKNT